MKITEQIENVSENIDSAMNYVLDAMSLVEFGSHIWNNLRSIESKLENARNALNGEDN